MTSKSRRKPSPSEGNLQAELLAAADAIIEKTCGYIEKNAAIETLRSRYKLTQALLDELAKLPPDEDGDVHRLKPLAGPCVISLSEYERARLTGLPYKFYLMDGKIFARIGIKYCEGDLGIRDEIIDHLSFYWASPRSAERLRKAAGTLGKNLRTVLVQIEARLAEKQTQAKRLEIARRALQDTLAPALGTLATLEQRGFTHWRGGRLHTTIEENGDVAVLDLPDLTVAAVPKGSKPESRFPGMGKRWTIDAGRTTIAVWKGPAPRRGSDKVVHLNELALAAIVKKGLVAPEAAVERGDKLLAGLSRSFAKIVEPAVRRTAERIEAMNEMRTAWMAAEAAFAPLKAAIDRLSCVTYKGTLIDFVACAPQEETGTFEKWQKGLSRGRIEIGPYSFGVALIIERNGSVRVRPAQRWTGRKPPSALEGKWTIEDAPELSRRILAEIAKLPVFPRVPLKASAGAGR